jgi:hypothetical protein
MFDLGTITDKGVMALTAVFGGAFACLLLGGYLMLEADLGGSWGVMQAVIGAVLWVLAFFGVRAFWRRV